MVNEVFDDVILNKTEDTENRGSYIDLVQKNYSREAEKTDEVPLISLDHAIVEVGPEITR